jgi:L-ascorbate metabolism protein UlaG (beta-lactamase superfamily)
MVEGIQHTSYKPNAKELNLASQIPFMSRIFGKLPTGARLARIKASPQYQKGKFSNQSFTPDLSEDATMWKVLKAYRHKPATVRPSTEIPTVAPDLRNLPADEPALIWLGHSSYFLRFEGLNILVDPVLNGRASPVPGMAKVFSGTDILKASALPDLDYVLITHDHYDHLDYETIRQLKPKTAHWITSLGVGEHFEYWGIKADKITELDWWESTELRNGCRMTATPARHFSGRGLKRAQSLWSSFVLQSERYCFYLGGDSGWDRHFDEIGQRFGPFDLAILECGQYHQYWKHIHMMPEEVADATVALKAKRLLPVHWAKFNLSLHPWDEPIERLIKATAGKPFKLLSPMIGETVLPLSEKDYNKAWWRL